MLGPGDVVWTQLYHALAQLARACGGSFAFVLDEGNGLWCVGLPDRPPTTATLREDRAADRFYRLELAPRAGAMRRGATVDIAKVEGDDRYVACSFAGIYVLVVWFDAPFDPPLVRARVRHVLPHIEALTLSLPPSGGPGSDASGKMRA